MNILLICQYAGSERLGMAYRPYYLAQALKKNGYHCSIVAASFSHTRYHQPTNIKNFFNQTIIDELEYVFLKTNSYKSNGFFRALSFIVFPFMLWFYSRKLVKIFKPDIVIYSSPTPLAILPVLKICRLARAKLIFEIRDLWPLTLIELGRYSKNNLFIRIMQFCENLSLKSCDKCVCVLPLAKNYLEDHGLSSQKFQYVPNGVKNDQEPAVLSAACTELINEIKAIKTSNRFVVGYAGAHGFANDLPKLVEIAEFLKDPSLAFVLIGSGPEKEKIQKQVKDRNLSKYFYFFNPVPKKEILKVTQEFDIGYIGLKHSSLFRYGISSNKLFDYMASKIPIIQVVDAGNDLVTDNSCGFTIKSGETTEVATAIRSLLSMPKSKREQLGQNGYNYLIKNHSYEQIALSYEKIFGEFKIEKNN